MKGIQYLIATPKLGHLTYDEYHGDSMKFLLHLISMKINFFTLIRIDIIMGPMCGCSQLPLIICPVVCTAVRNVLQPFLTALRL